MLCRGPGNASTVPGPLGTRSGGYEIRYQARGNPATAHEQLTGGTRADGVDRADQRQRARGDSLRAIADSLNRDTLPTAQGGKQWYAATVRHVLIRRKDGGWRNFPQFKERRRLCQFRRHGWEN